MQAVISNIMPCENKILGFFAGLMTGLFEILLYSAAHYFKHVTVNPPRLV